MTRACTPLDLTVEELDLIETSLSQTSRILADRRLCQEHRACVEEGPSRETPHQLGETLVQIQALLGRLRGQKSDQKSDLGDLAAARG